MPDAIRRVPPPPEIQEIADALGGTIQECAVLPDGSGFATVSYTLPANHWMYAEGHDEPPMPLRLGEADQISILTQRPSNETPFAMDPPLRLRRKELADKVRAAARYAIRASTGNGKETDFDPDAMVQNFVVGLLGYWTTDGLSHLDDSDRHRVSAPRPNPGS